MLVVKVYPFPCILTHMFGTFVVFAADENLTFAFEHCHCRARGNKRQECIRHDPLLIHMTLLAQWTPAYTVGYLSECELSLCLCCLTGGY